MNIGSVKPVPPETKDELASQNDCISLAWSLKEGCLNTASFNWPEKGAAWAATRLHRDQFICFLTESGGWWQKTDKLWWGGWLRKGQEAGEGSRGCRYPRKTLGPPGAALQAVEREDRVSFGSCLLVPNSSCILFVLICSGGHPEVWCDGYVGIRSSLNLWLETW